VKRSILGGIVGLVAATITIFVVEMTGHRIWPLPAGLDIHETPDFLSRMPVMALAWIVLGFAAGAFVGGLVAAAISRGRKASMVVGALLLVATILMFFEIPHPGWMIAAGLIVPLPSAWLGAWLMTRKR
jgi:hypothetical protein